MNIPKNDNKKSKARLAKLLRVEQDTERLAFVWDELEDYELTYDWQNNVMRDEEILEYARRALDRYHRHIGSGRSYSSGQGEKQKQAEEGVQKVSVKPTEREADAADAFRKYLAAHAARQPLVQRFRKENLPDGRLLTRDEVIEAFLAVQLDVEPDLAQYLDSHRGKPSNELPFRLHDELSAGDGQVITNEDMAGVIAKEQSEQERWLEASWIHPDAMASTSEEEESDPSWYLKELGEWLMNVYPWLHVGDAVVFVVSGRPPRLAEPLSAAMDMGQATYSITFSPWVAEETVLRAYRTLVSRHRRSPRDRTVRVLRFVSEQTDEEGRLPSWAKLLDRWNAANPDERFSDRASLYNAYKRAVEALVPPYLPLGL